MPSKDYSQYAPASWAERDFEFTLPSGDKCLLRKLGPTDLIVHGIQDQLDFVTSKVMNTHVKNAQRSTVERVKNQRAKAVGKPTVDEATLIQAVSQDPAQLLQFEGVLGKMLVIGVAAPKMHEPPEKEEDREDGLFYTDAVPFADKIAVFNRLMQGVKMAEQFRGEPEEAVGDVAPESSVRPAAKRAPRPRAKRPTG